ncbi:MAG: CDP-glycerol glycerophosphotransferase family protein [Bacillota bacterium]
MKRIYLHHYWLLYLDFINTFQDLTFKEIPLPLLFNFYQYIDEGLKKEMLKPGFKDYLNTQELTEEQIQPHFETVLNPLKKPLKAKPVNGKVLLNFDYLRFSPDNYSDYFIPKQTVIFARFKKREHMGIPVHCIKDYKINVTGLTQDVLEKANTIFSLCNAHPLFENQNFRNKFINDIPAIIETTAAVYRYLDEIPISCIIVGTTEEIICRSLTIIASLKGIPSICLQHGILMGEEAFLPVFSTKMAVYGGYEKEWYLSKGVAADRVVVTGHPRFDDIFNQPHMSKADFQKKYGLNAQKKWILIAADPHNVPVWNRLVQLLARESSIEIIIKPHPWEIKTNKNWYYEKLSARYDSVKLILSREVNLYDILPNVDAVIVSLSTVALEAMLFEKPLIIYKQENYKDRDYDYYDKMDKFVQYDPIKIVGVIMQLLIDKNFQREAENKQKEFLAYAYPVKKSGKRLLELMEEKSDYE